MDFYIRMLRTDIKYNITEAHKGAAKNPSDDGREKLQYSGANDHDSLRFQITISS